MNPNDIDYLTSEADRGGNLGDVLQVFVHDFTLRQGAGEAKVREVEKKIGGVTSELFILHKLLQDFQTRVNDDHDLIMRLQYEIEALHGRVKSLDSKHTTGEIQSGQLDLRIEQLSEQLNRNCEDTQQNVGRLLGNFARAQLARGNARHESSNNMNRNSMHNDYILKNDRNSDTRRVSPLQETLNSVDNNDAIESSPSDSDSHQYSVSDSDSHQYSVISQPTFPQTTTEVPNEEFLANDEHGSIGDCQSATMQPHSLCDESTSEEGGLQQTPVTDTTSVPENSTAEIVLESSISEIVLESSISEIVLESCNTEAVPEGINSDAVPEKITSEVVLENSNTEAGPESNSSVSNSYTVHEVSLCNGNDDDSSRSQTQYDSHPTAACLNENVISYDTCTHQDIPEVTASASIISQDIVTDIEQPKEKEENDTTKDDSAASCNVPTQSGDVSSTGLPQTTTKKNRSKRSRGRKRKDSQNTENQISSTNKTEEVCNLNETDTVQSNDLTSTVCFESETSCDFSEAHRLSEHANDRPYQYGNDETHLQNNEEQADEGQPSPLQQEEQPPNETMNDLITPQQVDNEIISTEEQHIAQNSEETTLQCGECQNHTYDVLEEENPFYDQQVNTEKGQIKRPFNITVEQTQNEISPEQVRVNTLESSSPQSKRRVTFHAEIDDDEIPDLSDVDVMTEEEIREAGKNLHKDTKRNPGFNRIEIKSPTGELTNIQPPKPRVDATRMESSSEEQKDEVVGMCANCSDLAKLRCGNCRQAFYCKRECQREHWKTSHKDQCRPYQVLASPELGRYIVASRDLKAGDIILKEEPLVLGPKQITEPICLGCYKRVDGSYRCQKCHWPMCGPQCEKSPDHQPECVVGMEIGSPIDISNFDEPNHFYEVVLPLRCLALKKKSSKKYEQLLSLDSHYDDRKDAHVYAENQKSIVNVLRNYFFLQQFPIEDIDSSEKSIHNVTGIIDVNALEIRLPEAEVLGLYPNFAMMEHSCTPNTKHIFGDNHQVILRAAVDIKRGEHLSTMYTHILWGTLARRDHLKHSKYFMCTCFRCSDPTELGTNFSTIRCQRCPNGFMLSAAPLDELADWLCTTCNETIKNEDVTDINLKLGEEIEKILASPTVPLLEELVQKHAKSTVHPNHYHLFATRHTLLQMYGRDPTYANEEYMKKKERMCQDFLKVCTALDPGMSRLAPYAGVALYEYHLAVLSRTRQDPDARQTDPVALKKDVETAKALLQQCIRVLQDEPKDQPEGQLCHVAQQNLIELRQWEANLFSP